MAGVLGKSPSRGCARLTLLLLTEGSTHIGDPAAMLHATRGR